MPHQCVHCGKFIEVGSREILEGCSNCKSRFFFYVKEDQADNLEKDAPMKEFSKVDKKKVEKDVRDILDIRDEEKPVILDLESVRVLGPGKFELDLVSLMNRKPIVFKLQEGKYMIDLEAGI